MKSPAAIQRSLVLVVAFLFAAPLVAHSITFKNGRVVYGTIVSQTRTSITLRVRGNLRTYKKSTIREISYRNVRPKPRKRPRPRAKKPPVKRPERVARAKVEPKTPARARPTPKRQPTEGEPINKWTITARSALLPGWGPIAMGDYWEGSAHAVLFLAAAGYSAGLRGATLAKENDYRTNTLIGFGAVESVRSSTGLPGGQSTSLTLNFAFGQLFARPYTSQLGQYNNSLNLLALVYCLQLAHAYYKADARHGERLSATGTQPALGEPSGAPQLAALVVPDGRGGVSWGLRLEFGF